MATRPGCVPPTAAGAAPTTGTGTSDSGWYKRIKVMIIEFEAYDAYDELLPKQKWDVQSSFECTVDPYVKGVWVVNKDPDPAYPDMNQVIPLYLTRDQLNQSSQKVNNDTTVDSVQER
jgi:hypothetical protein